MLPTLSLLHQLIDQWIDWCTERIKAQCGGSTNQGGLALISPSLVQSRTRSPCCTAQHEFLFTKEWKLLVSLTSVWISLLLKTTGTAATGNLQKRHQTFRVHATICAERFILRNSTHFFLQLNCRCLEGFFPSVELLQCNSSRYSCLFILVNVSLHDSPLNSSFLRGLSQPLPCFRLHLETIN